MQIRILDGLAEHSKASGRPDRHQHRFARHAVPAEADWLARGWGGGERAAPAAILLLDPGHHVAVTEVGLEIWIGLQVAIARQHIPTQPVPAPGAQPTEGVGTLAGCPGGELVRGAVLEAL